MVIKQRKGDQYRSLYELQKLFTLAYQPHQKRRNGEREFGGI